MFLHFLESAFQKRIRWSKMPLSVIKFFGLIASIESVPKCMRVRKNSQLVAPGNTERLRKPEQVCITTLVNIRKIDHYQASEYTKHFLSKSRKKLHCKKRRVKSRICYVGKMSCNLCHNNLFLLTQQWVWVAENDHTRSNHFF